MGWMPFWESLLRSRSIFLKKCAAAKTNFWFTCFKFFMGQGAAGFSHSPAAK